MDTRVANPGSRYLKTPDGTVYGPVDAITLCAWAAEARVTPGCFVSRDRKIWQVAEDIPELRLHWQTILPDGTVVGPLNLFALWELMQEGSLPRGLAMRNRVTDATVTLDEGLLPVALRESRAMLDVMAAQMAAGAGPVDELSEQQATLRARLARAEKELADTVRLMGESQRLLAAREQQVRAIETRVTDSEARHLAERRELESKLAEALRGQEVGRNKGLATAQAQQAEQTQVRAEVDRLKADQARAEAAWAVERDALTRRATEAVGQTQGQGLLAERLARAEKELANNLRLMGESQRLLVAREQQMKAMEVRLAERQSGPQVAPESQDAQAGRERDAERAKDLVTMQALRTEVSQARADVDRWRTAQERAEAAWTVERNALMLRAAEAAAKAKEHGQAVAAVEAKLVALTARTEVVQRESQATVAGMTTRMEAMRQAADVLKSDYESRLVAAQQAVEIAEGRSLSERQALEARLAAAVREGDALTSARDQLQTSLATTVAERDAAVADKEAAARRLQDVEDRVDVVTGERDAALRQLGALEQTVKEVAEREAALRRDMAAAETRWTAQNEAHEQTAALLRQSAVEAEAAWKTERDALLSQASGLEQRLADAERVVAERDGQLADAAKQREAILAEVSRNENSRLERADQRKREVEQTARSLGESRSELAAAQQALVVERERSAATEKRLMAEVKGLQRDLHALGMVKTTVRKLRDERPANGPMIDWLSGGAPTEATVGEPEDKFAGLDLSQQVDLLHQELKASLDEKERLRRDLGKVRADYQDLERRHESDGAELGAKVTQLQNELQSNAAIVQQTMAELERRESAVRQNRKKAEEREKELQERIDALEGRVDKGPDAPVVIEGQWEPPPRPDKSPSSDEAPPGNGIKGKPAATVLNSVEAQLQSELEKWHSLVQDKDKDKDKDKNRDKPQHWFRWKKS